MMKSYSMMKVEWKNIDLVVSRMCSRGSRYKTRAHATMRPFNLDLLHLQTAQSISTVAEIVGWNIGAKSASSTFVS
jgi:hypothetical protein